jgi:hypothetical protein
MNSSHAEGLILKTKVDQALIAHRKQRADELQRQQSTQNIDTSNRNSSSGPTSPVPLSTSPISQHKSNIIGERRRTFIQLQEELNKEMKNGTKASPPELPPVST